MSAAKFLSEVKRNRLFSNWVRETAGSNVIPSLRAEAGFSKANWRLVIMVGGLFILGLAAISLSFAEQVRESQSETSKSTPTSVAKRCSEGELREVVGVQQTANGLPQALPGYPKVSSARLGGIITSEFKCQSGQAATTYLVEWVFFNETWRLKRISRPPVRQSGDSKW
jgi:hypothetical protein